MKGGLFYFQQLELAVFHVAVPSSPAKQVEDRAETSENILSFHRKG